MNTPSPYDWADEQSGDDYEFFWSRSEAEKPVRSMWDEAKTASGLFLLFLLPTVFFLSAYLMRLVLSGC